MDCRRSLSVRSDRRLIREVLPAFHVTDLTPGERYSRTGSFWRWARSSARSVAVWKTCATTRKNGAKRSRCIFRAPSVNSPTIAVLSALGTIAGKLFAKRLRVLRFRWCGTTAKSIRWRARPAGLFLRSSGSPKSASLCTPHRPERAHRLCCGSQQPSGCRPRSRPPVAST